MLEGAPDWLVKWIASILRFMEFEESALPAELHGMKDSVGRILYPSETSLRLESHGVFTTRLQNVAITADRVKHFLTQQPAELRSEPPFRLLTDDEILDFLWFGANSIMKRLLRAACAEISDPPAIQLFTALDRSLRKPREGVSLDWVHDQMAAGFPVSPFGV